MNQHGTGVRAYRGGRHRPIAGIAGLILMLVACAGLAAGCGDGENKEEIAAEVAAAWVDTSIDQVSDALVEFIVGEQSAVTRLAGGVLSGQIRENLSWTYSVSGLGGEDRYAVTATAMAELRIEIPLLGDRVYALSAPFNLEVDTSARTVVSWSLDVLSAKVEERGG